LPTSLPRSELFWKIVQAGVHDQLWQNMGKRGMGIFKTVLLLLVSY